MHRRVLLEMVASENRDVDVDPLSGYASQELADAGRPLRRAHRPLPGRARRARSQADDVNPFILRDYDNCISCYRCVRVCAEQEGDYAISVMNRGFDTQITTEFDGLLKDSACTFCGQCVQTCPTGALGRPEGAARTRTCPERSRRRAPSARTAASAARSTS